MIAVKTKFLALLCVITFGCSQNNQSKPDSDSINNVESVSLIDSINLSIKKLIKSGGDENIDAITLSKITCSQITNSVNSNKIQINQIVGLKNDFQLNDSLAVYSLGYPVDGSKGYVNMPILWWKFNNVQRAYNFSQEIECTITQIVVLNESNNLYLLIGEEKGDGSCRYNFAYVLKILENEVIVDYPAFINRPYLNFCNGSFSYDKNSSILKFKHHEMDDYQDLSQILKSEEFYKQYKNDTTSSNKLIEIISPDYYENKEFQLKFNGESFESTKQ